MTWIFPKLVHAARLTLLHLTCYTQETSQTHVWFAVPASVLPSDPTAWHCLHWEVLQRGQVLTDTAWAARRGKFEQRLYLVPFSRWFWSCLCYTAQPGPCMLPCSGHISFWTMFSTLFSQTKRAPAARNESRHENALVFLCQMLWVHK